jgi:protein SCO1/2
VRSARVILPLTVLTLLGAGCGDSGGASHSDQNGAHTHKGQLATVPGRLTAGRFAGTAASPSKPAPPLRLKNSQGHQVDIDQYRGKAVLLTFIYTHCPDVCPLIVGNLHTAQSELGPKADDLQIIAVSVDPKGDTPRAVNAFLGARRMSGRMEYLLGSRSQLEKVWSDWGIVSRASAKKNDPDIVEHSALIYGIGANGNVTTLYPAEFTPPQIVHDVPILASE